MIGVGKEAILVMQTADHLNTLDDGTVTVSFTDGTVLSVQPNGSFEQRPEGSAGSFERAARIGSNLVYSPDGSNVYVVPFMDVLP